MPSEWPEADQKIKDRFRALLDQGLPHDEIERRVIDEFDLSDEEAARWKGDVELAADPYFCPAPLSELPPEGTTEITFGSRVLRPRKEE